MTDVYLMELKDDDDRKGAYQIALSMYLGETCPYCLIEFQTIEQLSEAVFNGYTDYGRIAHSSCFFAAHPEVIQGHSHATPPPQEAPHD